MIKSRPILSLIFCLTLFIQLTLNQSPQPDSCSNQNTCHECIQSKGCAWCSKPSLDQSVNEGPRCFSSGLISTGGYECESKFLVNPKNEQTVLENKPLTKFGEPKLRTENTNGQKIVQISPQRIGLKLRLSMF